MTNQWPIPSFLFFSKIKHKNCHTTSTFANKLKTILIICQFSKMVQIAVNNTNPSWCHKKQNCTLNGLLGLFGSTCRFSIWSAINKLINSKNRSDQVLLCLWLLTKEPNAWSASLVSKMDPKRLVSQFKTLATSS